MHHDESRRAQWRTPPRRYGPIEAEPAWIELLEDSSTTLCVAIAVTVLAIAGLMWGVDLFAGHIGG